MGGDNVANNITDKNITNQKYNHFQPIFDEKYNFFRPKIKLLSTKNITFLAIYIIDIFLVVLLLELYLPRTSFWQIFFHNFCKIKYRNLKTMIEQAKCHIYERRPIKAKKE